MDKKLANGTSSGKTPLPEPLKPLPVASVTDMLLNLLLSETVRAERGMDPLVPLDDLANFTVAAILKCRQYKEIVE